MARVLKIQCHVFRLYIRFVLLGMTSVNFSLAFVSFVWGRLSYTCHY